MRAWQFGDNGVAAAGGPECGDAPDPGRASIHLLVTRSAKMIARRASMESRLRSYTGLACRPDFGMRRPSSISKSRLQEPVTNSAVPGAPTGRRRGW
jgi:hypothetical protein